MVFPINPTHLGHREARSSAGLLKNRASQRTCVNSTSEHSNGATLFLNFASQLIATLSQLFLYMRPT
jgi:hypothetical protein